MNKLILKFLACVFACTILSVTIPAPFVNIAMAEAETKSIPERIDKQAGLLSALGALPEEVDFEKGITRAELASLVSKMMALDENAYMSGVANAYKDVPAQHPAIGAINAVTSMGIFGGYADGTFHPDQTVKYEEAIKVMVNLCGFSAPAESAGGFPSGYLAVAHKNKMLSGISAMLGKELTWSDAIILAYNTLNTDSIEFDGYENGHIIGSITEGNTLLALNRGIYTAEGQITGTVQGKIFGTGMSRDIEPGEVEIGTIRYIYDTEKLPHLEWLTGYQVEYYYREAESSKCEYEIIYVYVHRNNNELTLNSYEIEEVYGFGSDESGSPYIMYYVDDDNRKSKERLRLDEDLAVIVNGNEVPIVTNATLKPACGFIVFIDSNGDNIYDTGIVTAYEMKIVDVVSIYDEHIYFKGDDTFTPLVLNPLYADVTYEIWCDGEQVSLNTLRENDVLGIIRSERDRTTHIKIEVLSSKAEGIISAMGSDIIEIDGVEYEISPDLNVSELKPGDSGVFFFDFAERLFYYEEEEDEYPYIYLLINAGAKGTLSSQVQLQMLYDPHFSFKEVMIFDTAESVRVNGVRLKGSAVLDALKLPDGSFLQPVKYVKFNDAGEVISIETTQASGPKEMRTYLGTGAYNEAFGDIKITYDTKIYYVPSSGELDDYLVGQLQRIYFNTDYLTQPFGVYEENGVEYAEAIFLWHNRSYHSDNGVSTVNKERPMLIGDIKNVRDAENDVFVYQVKTYNNGGTFTYQSDPDFDAGLDSLKVGDVVFVGLSGNSGEDYVDKVAFVQKGKIRSSLKKISLDGSVSYYAQPDSAYGLVDTIRSDVRKNKAVVNLNLGDDKFASYDIFGRPIYLYDRSTNEVSIATTAAVRSTEIFGAEDASEIYINFNEDEINMVVIINN